MLGGGGEVTLTPVNELAFRTTGAVSGSGETLSFQAPTGWAGGFPKTETDATNHAIECNYSNQFFVLQMYDVTEYDLNFVSSLTLTINMQNATTYKLGAWVYPDADWTEADQKKWAEGRCPIVEKFKSVVGVYPGHVNTTETYLVQAERNTENTIQTMTFSGATLKALADGAVKKEDKVYVSLIITFSETKASYSTNRNPKMYCMTAAEDKQPVMSFEYKPYVEGQPTLEYQYRTKGNNDGWNDNSYPKAASADNKALENGFQQHFAVGMQYAVKGLDKSCTYTLKLDIASGPSSAMYAWEYPNAIPTINAKETAIALATFVEETTGTAMGGNTAFTGIPLAGSACVNSWWTLNINAADLQYATEDAWGYVWLNLILLQDPTSANKPKIASSFDDNPDHRPIFTTAYANVYNETQDLTYDDLNTACGAANTNDIIRVNNDLSTNARINITHNPVTIYGRTPQTKIKFTTCRALMFLTKDYSSNDKTYIKNLTLVNDNNSPRDAHGIEVNKPTVLENVTFVSEAGYNDGKCDVYSSQQNVTLVGNNILPGGILLADNRRIDDGIDGSSPRTTHTTPIAVTLANIGEDKMVVAHGWGARKDMYQLTNEGYALYVVAGNGDLKTFAIQPITLSETEDNTDLIAKYKGIETDITLSRTIAGSASDYSTLCLPFETTIGELGAAEVLAYDYATVNGDEATLTFSSVTDLEAGKPYLVRFATNQTNRVFTGKTITAATPGKYGDEHYEFIGLFNQTKITETANHSMMYLGNANTLYWAGNNCTIKGSRGYLKAVSAPAKAARHVAIGGHGAPTSIDNPTIGDSRTIHNPQKLLRNGQLVIIHGEQVYNAQGQMIK